MDIGTPTDTVYVPNDVIIALRKSHNWGRERLARQFKLVGDQHGIKTPDTAAIVKQIYRLETGRTQQPSKIYEELYCLTFDKSAAELFGTTGGTGSDTKTVAAIRSHKFIPVFVGIEATSHLLEMCSTRTDQWTDCGSLEHFHPNGVCDLYVWPFGVVLFHLVEDLELGCVADLSVWRLSSYVENQRWASAETERITGQRVGLPYVLSVYWVGSHGWNDRDLRTALKLMCMPRILLERDCEDSARAQAVQVEKNLICGGFDHPDLVDFGIHGTSLGFASWSGVVYHPVAQGRALHERDLVACELSVQAIWAYCEFIRRVVEQGQDPIVPQEFGWRFLRGIRSRITNERPHENEQHRAMRDAIVRTSGLDRHLAQTVEILKESDNT